MWSSLLVFLLPCVLLGNVVRPAEGAGKGGYVYYSTAMALPLKANETDALGLDCKMWQKYPNINTMHHGFLKPTPTITNGPVDKVVFPTDHGGVTFLCDYSGGTGKVTWYFQPDNPISPSSWIAVGKPGFPAEAKQAGNGLGFDPSVPIKATSQGSYYCKVTVSHVGSVVSRPATLSLARFSVSSFPPSYAEFSNWLSVDGATDRAQPFITYKYIRPGSSVLLACDIGVDWPAYRNITWTLNRSPVIMQLHMQEVLEAVEATSSAPGHMMLPNGSLYLWSVPQVLNGGIYQCHATSPSGMVAGSSTETRLMVSAQEPLAKSKPSIHLSASNKYPVAGEHVVLTCQVSNLTRPGDPDISWSYKGQELREVQEVNDIDCSRLGSTVTTPFMALDNMLVLVVCDISLAMTGSYSCSLQYSAGDVDDLLASVISDTVSIDVLYAPTRRDSPLHDVVDLPPVFPNATVEMDCTQYITRGAGSHVKWWYNGRVVKHGSGEHAWTLSTNNSQPGIFQCIVHNAYGAASVTYRVRVPGLPAPVDVFGCNSGDGPGDNPICWEPPESFNSSITHYFIAERIWARGRRFKFKHTWLLNQRLSGHKGIMAEVCRSSVYGNEGKCNVLLVACNAFGCGRPVCTSIKGQQDSSPLGFHNLELTTGENFTVFVKTEGVTGNLICKAFFKLRRKQEGNRTQGSIKEYIKDDICDSNSLTEYTHTFSGLDACTEYSACIAANLSAYHAGLDVTDIGSMWCDGQTHKWVSIKTDRSHAPDEPPVVEKVFKAGRDSIVIYQSAAWCDVFPHTLFQWQYHTPRHSMLVGHHRYYLQPYLPASNSSLSRWSIQTGGLAENCMDCSLSGRSCSFGQLKSARAQPDLSQCSETGSEIKTFEAPALLTIRHVGNNSSISMIHSNWTIHKSLKPRLTALLPYHQCVQNDTNVTALDPQALAANATNFSMALFLDLSNGNVTCRVWLSARVANVTVQMSEAQVITFAPAADELSVAGQPPSNSGSYGFFQGNWLGLMLGSVGVVLVLLVTTLVFLWRRKHPEVPLAETGGYVITNARWSKIFGRDLPDPPSQLHPTRVVPLPHQAVTDDDSCSIYGENSALAVTSHFRRELNDRYNDAEVVVNTGCDGNYILLDTNLEPISNPN